MNLSIFSNNLFEAGTEFFNQLGIQLNSNTASSLGAKELLKDHYKDKGIFQSIDEAYFLGLVDDSVFDGNTPLLNKEKISLKEAEDRLTAEYNGLMVFAVWLKGSYSPTRGEIADLTRAFNRVSKSVPVVLLLKYGGLLSFAASERTKYKQAWREGEKIGKISLLKDIKVAAPHTGHLKILDDLKVAPAVKDFNALYKQWQEVFNVQLLNKKFYQELANWYFWALRNVEFPEDAEKHKDVRNAISVIRMITRLIFIWFVKEKGLIPDDLFNEVKVREILVGADGVRPDSDVYTKPGACHAPLQKKHSTYYKAILQNLFFATLNTEMNKDKPGSRKFRGKNKGDGRDQHYMIHNVFRYEDYFTSPQDTLKKYFENIPFLNGGLFECFDKEIVGAGFKPALDAQNTGRVTNPPLQKKTIRIDGFSDRADNPLKIPDHLFFSPEQPVDLNEIYGTKNKTYKVRGLIDILDSYKFTVDENTPIEEEIALDPELLGKVFENLLASYNPETHTTARKQTGSFYTPREIVNYMVDESIIAYLSNALDSYNCHSREGGNPEAEELDARLRISSMTENKKQNNESRLRHLVAYNDQPHQFTPTEVDVLINAINTLKALDPACGSGAFPMGMLHKLVYILGKLDPDNSKWREVQRQKAIKETEEAYNIGDKEEREKRLLDISEVFENNASDYGRKLYLIENCIFGVDIQPIAVQIAKLRFFVSLIVDQRIDSKKENLGVRPLPNLETKFVAANSLLDVLRPGQQLLRNLEIMAKETELKRIRAQHFLARTPQTKNNCRAKDAKLRGEIAKLLQDDGWDKHTAQKLAAWDPYDQNASADFFDSEWMFGVTEGFDIVIGNPPYIQIQSFSSKPEQKAWEQQKYSTYVKTGDVYCLFYEKGFNLLTSKGVLTFITSNKWMRANYGKAMRKFFLTQGRIAQLIDFGDSPIFENATTYTNILVFHKNNNGQQMNVWDLSRAYESDVSLEIMLSKEGLCEPLFIEDSFVIAKGVQTRIKKQIEELGIPLKEWDIEINYGIKTGINEAFIISGQKKDELIAKDPKSGEIIRPILRGRDIKRYKAEFADLWIIATFPARQVDINKYPVIKQYLKSFGKQLEQNGEPGCRKKTNNKWFEVQDTIAYHHEFNKEKIVYAEIVYDSAFFYDTKAYYPEATAFIMTGERLKYLTALLNSKLLTYSFKTFYAGGDLRGNTFRYKKVFLENLPVPKLTAEEQRPFETLIDQILVAKKKDPKADTSALERQIDQMVYKLYGLTDEEIRIVEGEKN